METSRNKSFVSFFQMESLFWRHTIRPIQHFPSLSKRHFRITPLVKSRMFITFSQDHTTLVHSDTSLLGSQTIIKVTFAMGEVMIKIAKHHVSRPRYQNYITIKIIYFCQIVIRLWYTTFCNLPPYVIAE